MNKSTRFPRSSNRIAQLLLAAVLAAGVSSVALVASHTRADAVACQGCIVLSAPTISLNVTAEPGQQAQIDKQGGVAVYTPLTTGTGGGPGTVWLVGHRTTHGSVFNRVPSLQPGDPIELTDATGVHEYTVERMLVVTQAGWSNDIDINDTSRSQLILQTSHPDSNLRYLIQAFGSAPELCRTQSLATGGTTLSGAPARFVSIAPQRLLDTRADGAGAVCADGNVELQIAGVAGISASATAVALTITATDSAGAGFVSAGPAGFDPTATSTVNLSSSRQSRANLVMVAIGEGGRVVLHTSVNTHLIVDVSGYYEPSGSTHEGRFLNVTPDRLLDTRNDASQDRLAANETVTVNIAERNSDVPVGESAAVLVNLTAVNGAPSGYVTAWASGMPQPTTSNVNVSAVGDAAANLAIIPLGADGSIQLFASADLDVIIDIVGYFTNANAAEQSVGLFVPLLPIRIVDSRGTQTVLRADSTSNIDVLSPAGITGPAILVTNLTSTGSTGQGFVAVTDGSAVATSNLNISNGETRANLAVIAASSADLMHLYSSLATDIIIDVTGYFTADAHGWSKFGWILIPE